MPIGAVKRRRNDESVLTDELRRVLERGNDFFRTYTLPERSDLDLATLRPLWREHGKRIMREWIARFPASRPWGWWAFDSREPRRLISGPGSDSMRPDAPTWVRGKLWFGLPRYSSNGDRENPSEYESEFDYLSRLGLMSAAEAKAAAARNVEESRGPGRNGQNKTGSSRIAQNAGGMA